MSRREYRVEHMNTEDRVVAVCVVVSTSRIQAIRETRQYALDWNHQETRPNMITKFMVCEGYRVDLPQADPRTDDNQSVLPLF